MFDWEHGIAMHAMQRKQASSRGEGECHGLSPVAAGPWGIFLRYGGDGHLNLMFVQQCQVSCLVLRDTSGISTRLDRSIGTLLHVRRETQCPFLVATVI